MKSYLLVFVFLLAFEYGYSRRRPGGAGRGPRGRCMGRATHVHMHTGGTSSVDPVHQGRDDDTHIHVHVSLDGSRHAPPHAPDGYIYSHAAIQPNSDGSVTSNVMGFVHLRQMVVPDTGPVEVKVDLQGFEHTTSGHTHAFHIHQYGDTTGGCQATGSRFNPFGDQQGAHSHDSQSPTGPQALSDWGVLECDSDGLMDLSFNDNFGALFGEKSYIGHAIVVHAHGDDAKLACGIIGHAAPHAWPGSDAIHEGHGAHEHAADRRHGSHGSHGHHGHDHQG